MANVLILSLVFPPDSVSTAHIIGELAVDLKGYGHSVTVLTTRPHYNRDLEAEARQPIRSHWGAILGKSEYFGIPVYHTLMPRKGASIAGRLAAWVGFHTISVAASALVRPQPDIIIAPSPPLTMGLEAWLIGLLRRCPYVYNVQEIYPDIAINLGMIRNSTLISFFRGLENFIYRRAAAVTVIAPRMRENLLRKGVPQDKVSVIPNFVDLRDMHPGPKTNEFSRQYKIDHKFVVSYAGNLGPAQGLETFLGAASLLREHQGIHFLMVGDGISSEWLKITGEELELSNLTMLSYQPYSIMPQIYAASDVSLVPLAVGTGSDAVPSKVYRIMACARPVLASSDLASDLAELVTDVKCGLVVKPGSASELAKAILEAYSAKDECARMGEAGRRFVVEHVARPIVTRRYHDLVACLTSRRTK